MTNGYYWVKYQGEWQIAHHSDGDWRLFYIERIFKESDFDEVRKERFTAWF